MKNLDHFDLIYKREMDDGLLTHQEERVLLSKRTKSSREKLIRANLRLVLNIASKFEHRGLELADLVEEGIIGLIEAINRFDLKKGNKFSTYATLWIRKTIRMAIMRNFHVHIPDYLTGKIRFFNHCCAILKGKLGRVPTVEEIADKMKLTPSIVQLLIEAVKVHPAHLLMVGKFNSDVASYNEVEEILPDEVNKLHNAVNLLDKRTTKILNLHYGLNGNKALSVADIGVKIDLTKERVRQLRNAGLGKLKEMIAS